MRRRLGPIAWAVLEDVALDALADGDSSAATSVRRVAANVGLSKDATARALRRLAAADLVVRLQPARRYAGQFARAEYRLSAEVLGLFSIDEPSAPVTMSPGHRLRRPRIEQAALFDPSGLSR